MKQEPKRLDLRVIVRGGLVQAVESADPALIGATVTVVDWDDAEPGEAARPDGQAVEVTAPSEASE